MVNATFATAFTYECKYGCKCGIYHVCHRFALEKTYVCNIFAPCKFNVNPFFRLSALDALSAVGNCDVTAKALFAKLLSIVSSPAILRRLQAQIIGPGLSLNGPWSLVRNSFSEKFKNDLLWVIFTP